MLVQVKQYSASLCCATLFHYRRTVLFYTAQNKAELLFLKP